MNIFAIEGFKNDIDWEKSARSLDDLRIVKMVLETTQLISTTLHLRGIETKYKPTHVKHPSRLWLDEKPGNLHVLLQYAIYLEAEYSRRFNKTHKCCEILIEFSALSEGYPGETSPVPLCMPDEYKIPGNVVESYRNYYANKDRLRYKRSEAPEWIYTYRKNEIPVQT